MKWVRRIGIGLATVVLLAIVAVYAASYFVIGKTYSVAPVPLRAATDPAAIAEGGRIARVVQCRGCHGDAGKGQVFIDTFTLGRIGPPGLARKAALYSDADFERLIRHGVKRDGTGVYIMPTDALSHLSDRDVAAIIGWIRTLKPAPDDQVEPTRFGPLARLASLSGGLTPNVVVGDTTPVRTPEDRGRYLVSIACAQCHRLHDSAPPNDGDQMVPPLVEVSAAYDLPAFKRLLHTGKGLSPRDLGIMSRAVREGLYALRDDEITAIQRYLATQVATPG